MSSDRAVLQRLLQHVPIPVRRAARTSTARFAVVFAGMIAVVQVLQHLINFGAIGAISTHDLELADEPDLMSVAKVVHFRETIRPDAEGNEQMTFDYLMRQGVSPTTNALRLLQMVGLGEDLKASSEETHRA